MLAGVPSMLSPRPAGRSHVCATYAGHGATRLGAMSNRGGRRHPAQCVGPLEKLVGSSPAIRAVRRTIPRLARLDTPLLITGEVGTGKCLLARTLHQVRAGASGYFELDCNRISEEYFGLEMFGIERGTISWVKKS